MLGLIINGGVIVLGYLLIRYGLLPKVFKNHTETFQSVSLCFMLMLLGYKIGINENVRNNIHILGFKSLVIAVIVVLMCILFVHVFYRRKWSK